MTTATLMRSLRFHSSFGKYIRRKRCSITNRLSHLATSSSSNYTSKKLIDDKEWKQKLQKGPSFHDFLTMSQKKEENVATSIEEIKQMLSEIDMQEV
jgi:HKD family nuclease